MILRKAFFLVKAGFIWDHDEPHQNIRWAIWMHFAVIFRDAFPSKTFSRESYHY